MLWFGNPSGVPRRRRNQPGRDDPGRHHRRRRSVGRILGRPGPRRHPQPERSPLLLLPPPRAAAATGPVVTMTACMRWSPGRVQTWRRPADGGFDPSRYGVQPIAEAPARTYVETRHYSGSYPAAALRYGLHDLTAGDRLAGVAVFSIPMSDRVLTSVFPHLAAHAESLELGRFVLDDAVPANGESWFLGQVFRLAAASGLCGVVSFSDPLPRRRGDGSLVMPGHVGTIYQASNAVYTGRSASRTLRLLPDGSVFSDRAAQKIRAQDRGHEYAEKQLTAFGARPRRAAESPSAWLAGALADVTRPVRHQGNHRYAFRLGPTRRARAGVVITRRPAPYPKELDGSQAALFDLTGGTR